MSQKQKVKELVEQGVEIHTQTRTSCVELQNYIYYQYLKASGQKSNSFVCGKCGVAKATVSQSFKRAFKTFSPPEKAKFYLQSVLGVKRSIEELNQEYSMQEQSNESKQTSIFIKDDERFKKWVKRIMRVNKRAKILIILDQGFQIDLHHYIIRKSMNKDKNAIAFESVKSQIKPQTIRISTSTLGHTQFQNWMKEVANEAHIDFLKELLQKENKFPKQKKQKQILEMPTFTQKPQMKKQKSITQIILEENYEKVRSNLLENQVLKALLSLKDFKQVQKGIFHQKDGKKVRKKFQFSTLDTTQEEIINCLENIDNFKIRKSSLVSVQMVDSHPLQKSSIYREVVSYKNQQIEYIYLRHYFKQAKAHYFIDKTVKINEYLNPEIIRGHIEHCIWKIRTMANKISLLVEASIQYSGKVEEKMKLMSDFIGDFNFLKKEVQFQPGFQEQISLESEDFDNEISIIGNNEHKLQFYTITGVQSEYEFEKPLFNGENYLEAKCLYAPQKKGEPSLINSSKDNHWLFKNRWEITAKGELICIDFEAIETQRTLLKRMLKKIGKQILSGKNVMNISLPVEGFTPESFLERIASLTGYAPKILQKASKCQSAVDRFVLSFCYGFTSSLAYAKMKKPFNPILGETYQALVDGCPVYLEQISHHPPISSLFMKGRGYTIYQRFQPSIQMGFNKGIASDDGHLDLYFQSMTPNRIIYRPATSHILGVVFGDRKYTFTKSSSLVDEANHLITVIKWQRNKNAENQLGKFYDYFEGEVIQMKNYVDLSNLENVKFTSENIEKRYGYIYGRWTKQIYFSGEMIFDFEAQVPFKVENYVPALESDSRFRKDLMLLRQKDMEKAQVAKEQLEQIQRNDRKLRKKFYK